MKPTKSNPHAWFFSYVAGLEGYNKDFEKEIRQGIVLEFTSGLTGSLSELYAKQPETYRQMRAMLTSPPTPLPKERGEKEKTDALNKARKRLIAVLFSFLKKEKETEQQPSMVYVKKVACKAANAESFNDIPLDKLGYLYRVFGTKNTANLTDTERKLVWSAMRKENQN